MDVITFPKIDKPRTKFVYRLFTDGGLQILLHGAISLPDATSYDKRCLFNYPQDRFSSKFNIDFWLLGEVKCHNGNCKLPL